MTPRQTKSPLQLTRPKSFGRTPVPGCRTAAHPALAFEPDEDAFAAWLAHVEAGRIETR